MRLTVEMEVERGESVHLLEVIGHYYAGERARLYGHPDTWHPGADSEVEIETVLLAGAPWTGELSAEEEGFAYSLLETEAAESYDEGPDPDEYADDDR